MKTPPRLAAAVVVALLLTLPAGARADEAPDAAATLESASGTVDLIAASGRSEAKPPARLAPGARVKTGGGSFALLTLDDGSKIRVGENSELKVEKPAASGRAIALLRGTLDGWVDELGARRLSLRVPGAVASARAAAFSAATDGSASRFDLYRGELPVTDSLGRGTILTPRQRASVSAAKFLRGTSSLPSEARAPAEPAVAALKTAPSSTKTRTSPVSILPPPPPEYGGWSMTASRP